MRKNVIRIISLLVALITLVGTITGVLISKKNDNSTGKVDELYIRKILDGYSVDDIVDDPAWKKDLQDATEDYVTVDAMRFDFSKQLGAEHGTTNLYFNHETRKIEQIVHNYVAYTNDLEPKKELENVISNIQGNISKLLGNPTQPFMLMNTSGEFTDYSSLSVDEMIEKLLKDPTVMYTLFESNGLRYEVNVMFSNDTIYTMTWIYDEANSCVDENCEHEH